MRLVQTNTEKMEILRTEQDFYTSLIRALEEIDPKYEKYKGVVVLGSHAPSDVENKLETIRLARENKTPLLGICMGMQLMAIEFARNVLGMPRANSTEIDPQTPFPIVKRLKELRVGMKIVNWEDGTTTHESHWHQYAFNPIYVSEFKNWNFSLGDEAVEMIRLRDHPFFLGTQFHAEYQSSKDKPHKLLVAFIEACKKYTKENANRN